MTDTAAQPRGVEGLALQRGVALTMLFVVGTINFVDRQLLSVLVEPIRAEMHLSDTQFGLLTGLAFALFYAGMGVPVAILADRWNRVRLIALACVVWSLFTALTGKVTTFTQLALVRFGVGAGEAGGTAPSLSLVSDLFPPHRRPFAVAIFQLNGPFGVFVGAAFGAWAAANIGWRGAFLVMGAVGLVIAPLLVWAVKEPQRGQMDVGGGHGEQAVPLRETLALFVRSPSLRLVLLGNGLSAFVSYGILNWVPAFLMRSQGMPLPAIGQWFGPAAGLTFGIGILGSGWLVSRIAQRDRRAYGYVPGIASLLIAPGLAAALLMQGWQGSLAVMLLPLTACTVYIAPGLALVQNLTPPRSRATAAAILLLMYNIVGLGLGPLFVGMLSDFLRPQLGDDSLRWGLMGIIPFALAAAATQFAMTRHLDKDLAA
ncbi:MFS transporter [Novosphingobium sp.]|uniref:spinster family MFS transporter n=1 Tax=Novosphingobium sp. TaxID=1874826 RepID=UPI001EC0A3CB|nr:MFS transporter [Novosphingobium sp.]MBK6800627.1 MFS transporter [Novosphingobium sp.]MBK9011183.1 MFS transporter [Novosphingobium sp.]